MIDAAREGFHRVVKTVASPLRFFAVAAVSLTSIVVVLAWKSTLPPEVTSTLIIIAFCTLVLIIFLVTFLVIFAPKKLVFDQEAHLTVMREQLGDSELGQSYLPGQLTTVQPNAKLPSPSSEK